MSKKHDCFHPGDQIYCDSNGGKMVAKVISISGPLMTINITAPKIGETSNIPVNGWKLVGKPKTRCECPPRVGKEDDE